MTGSAFFDQARNAHHEAAHAVVATIHGIPVRYVTVRPRRTGWAGLTRLRHPKAESPWQGYCAVLAAGPIADDVYTRIRERPHLARAAGDYDLLRDAARQVRQETRARRPPVGIEVSRNATVRAIAELAWRQAHRDLVANYGAVLAVAERLLSSRRTLAGAEIQHLADTAVSAEMPHADLAGEFWPSWFMRGWWTHERRS